MYISKSTLATWKKKVEEVNGEVKPKRRLGPNNKFLVVISQRSQE